MPLPLVIIHGWSDQASSFNDLAAALATRCQVDVKTINLGQWESMDDLVTYDDLVARLDAAWNAAGLPRAAHSVDVIVHSTGSLLVRDWLVRYFTMGKVPDEGAGLPSPASRPPLNPTTPPIKHFVMLAPANFGSPLAAKGSTFIGRVVKGWSSGELFQVGAKLLKGLELASAYTWRLAEWDRFGPANVYAFGNVLCTVIVGNAGYTGISAAANEPGSDGTVRVSTASMNCLYVTADLTGTGDRQYATNAPAGRTALRVMDGLNHGTIHDPSQLGLLDAIDEALKIDDAGFDAYCDRLDAATRGIVSYHEQNDSDPYRWGYQNTTFFVHDQFGQHVADYFVEFYCDAHMGLIEGLFHEKVLKDVHAFSDDGAYRAMLVDTRQLGAAVDQLAGDPLKISLTAQPELSQNRRVGYRTFDDSDIGSVALTADQAKELFQPNRTVLLNVEIRRYHSDDILNFIPAPAPEK